MSPAIVRRFEVRRAGPLGVVENQVQAAVQDDGEGQVAGAWTRVERPPLLDVRLRGAMSAVFAVSDRVRAIPGAGILRDLPTVLQPDRVYPDPDVLLRVGVEPGRRAWDGPAPPAAPHVTVAVVDSGMMIDHPDLRPHAGADVAGRAVPGLRLIDGHRSDDVTDEDGHGTMLAGTILTVAGGCPAVRLVPVKFFDAAVLPATPNAVEAIDVAVQAEADIINLSWDVGLGSPALRGAIARACERGALVVMAAGNDGSDNDRFPAVPAAYASVCRERTITVMATDRFDERAWFSNYGADSVDLAAPGVGVMTTRVSLSRGARRYGRHTGTSVAAALVTGTAALLKAVRPDLSAADLKACIVGSVDRRPRLACASGGRLNIPAALRCAGAPPLSPGGRPAAGGAPGGPGAPDRGSRTPR